MSFLLGPNHFVVCAKVKHKGQVCVSPTCTSVTHNDVKTAMVLHESWIASTFGKNAVGHTIRRNAVTSNGMTADAERVSLQQLLGICISIYITMKLYQITYIMGHT